MAGAKIYLLCVTPRELPVPVRATSDSDGRFRFDATKASFNKWAAHEPWYEAILVARAEGYGMGIANLATPAHQASYAGHKTEIAGEMLHLTKDDVPITGRILDLEGKPCAGVAVQVRAIQAPTKDDLSAFIQGLKETKLFYPTRIQHLMGFEGWIGHDLAAIFPPAKTASDGRFTIHGIGRERLAMLSLAAPTVVTTEVYAVTRAEKMIEVPNSWNRGDDEAPIQYMALLSSGVALLNRRLAWCWTRKPIARWRGAVVKELTGKNGRSGPILHQCQHRRRYEGRYVLTGLPTETSFSRTTARRELPDV